MPEQLKKSDNDPFREGVRAVTGILGALRDAIEQSFDDLKDKGEMSPDKAKEAAKETMNRAEDAVSKVRERLDFATRKELDELRDEVAELRRRVNLHEAGVHAPQDTGSHTPPHGDVI
jgi:polyhydroxyalkanoate synthesis regulator phasin